MKKSVKYYLYLMLFSSITSTVFAGGRSIPPGNVDDNIALGKTYTMSEPPNYSLCTDAGDVVQLTDDYTHTETSSMWTQISTVGWVVKSPIITIDMGVVQPIKGVSFYTSSRGTAGVYWPTAINIKVSNDNINYYSIGDLVSLSNQENSAPPSPDNLYRSHCYQTTNLTAHGRYVSFEVVRNGSFVFVDEIKVIRGNNLLLGQNIALNKTYTMTPDPNYSLCTDQGDISQLTDGIYYTGASSFWTQAAYTVGWNWISSPEINIDLGSVQPIEGISFNTAAGTESAGVSCPISILVMVSDNGSTYYRAGEITSLSTEHGSPQPFTQSGSLIHSYWTDRLATYGRYVKIIPTSAGVFLFTDEIEIYKGHDGMLNQSRGTAVTDLSTLLKKDQIRGGTARRIMLDIQDVQQQTDNENTLTALERDDIESLLDESANELIYLADADPTIFETELPLNTSHFRVFSALQKLWSAQGKSGLIGWITSPWEPLIPTQEIGTIPANTGLKVTMMQNEYRTVAFNLSNASAIDMAVSVNITGLPGGTNPSYVKVKEVTWTDTIAGIPVIAALPDADSDASGYIITIPAGMTRQICLTLHPTNSNPGRYGIFNGSITAGTVSVPIKLKLSRLSFPEQPALSLGGWDYTNKDSDNGMTLLNRSALIAKLRENFVDTTWATNTVMPSTVSFTQLDNWINRWTNVRNYRIFLNVNETFKGYQMGTQNFSNAVTAWINAYAAHWITLGLNLNQIGLHLLDEPRTANDAAIIINWANVINAAQPDIKIWINPVYSDPQNWGSLFAVSDILCPVRPAFIIQSESYRNVYRNSGKSLSFYSCIAGGALDYYSYYRLQAWTSWKENARSMFFWSFTTTGGASSWNEYNAALYNSCPVFLDPADSVVITGKRMEAIREGIEDYEYLNMLQTRINTLSASGGHPKLAAAQLLLDGAADIVLNATDASKLYLSMSKDRKIADQKRTEILAMLESLNNISDGKVSIFNPAPNYSLCTDGDDEIQLTDNYTYVGTSSMWSRLSTVGWVWKNPTITIDLGAIQPIKGISFYTTARGAAGVYWPTAINIKVSDDNINYSNVGDLVSLSNQENGSPPTPDNLYRLHCYQTNTLVTQGRYVSLEIVPNGAFVFVDEINIFEN